MAVFEDLKFDVMMAPVDIGYQQSLAICCALLSMFAFSTSSKPYKPASLGAKLEDISWYLDICNSNTGKHRVASGRPDVIESQKASFADVCFLEYLETPIRDDRTHGEARPRLPRVLMYINVFKESEVKSPQPKLQS